MLWVGLTGGIGTGKSTVTRILRQENLPVVDADELAKEVVKNGTPGHQEVVYAFGIDAISSDGELDRKKIASQVFADKSKLSVLESIIHPRVRALSLQKKDELRARGEKLAFYDVPLLFEKKMESLFDQIVVVTCSPKLQKERMISRDGLTGDEAKKRLAVQLPLEKKVRAAHFTIENNGTFDELRVKVLDLIKQLKALS